MTDLPKKSIRITDLTRIDTPTKIDEKQELLLPAACNQTEKDTFAMPLNAFVTWLLQKHAANRSLSNLDEIGQAIIDAKQDYFNKVAANTDLNTFTSDGIWKVQLTGGVECHAPGSGVGYYVVSVDTNENGLIEQQARNLNASSGNIYHRQRINGTWTGWGLITQDMGSPTFTNAPSVVNPGTQDDQLATIGQLNGKFSDIFQTEYYITEGVLVKGDPDYNAGVFTLPSGATYYTNDSLKVTLDTDSTVNIASNVIKYVFADATGAIQVWDNFSKAVAFPLVMLPGHLYYNIYTDQYADENGYYSLCPLGIVDNGVYTQNNTIQFLNIDNLKATLDALNVQSKVDIEIGTEIQNSRISSDTQYERQMSAGHFISDGEGGWDLDFGAGVLTQSHSEDENVEGTYNKDVLATLYAEDNGVRTEINITPSGGATLTSPDTDNVAEKIATAKDIRELETTSLTFKGYVATSTPSSSTYALMEGDLWINSSTMPTSFPVAASSIKKWNGSSWVNYGTTYTAKNFDFFRNINDNEGYYWFGGQWVVMSTDMSTDYFVLNQTTGKWEIKSNVNLPGKPTAGADATTSAGLVRKGQMDSAFAGLANVARSGSYNDLSNRPTIGNATIIIKQGGVEKGRFTTNQTSNGEINLERGGSLIDIDNNTITENSSDELQAIGTVNKNTAAGATQYVYDWIGTAAEYAAQNIESAHPEWLCFITDDEDDDTSIYTQSEVNNLLSTKADVNLSNIESDAKNISNWSSNVSNCIIETPQDIKLELSNGTLTLKAGSKVYVPNGSGVFDSVTITADVSATRTDNQQCMAWYNVNSNTMQLFPKILFYSGVTAPTGQTYMFWYDTTNNKCKVTSDGGSTWIENKTLPLCIVSTDGTKISAIDQVFNGFGYVGSTVFALPGVKGLAPNGRNADGTLKNIEFTVSSVLITTDVSSSTGGLEYYLSSTSINRANFGTYSYDAESNNIVNSSGVRQNIILIDPSAYRTSGKVTSFTPKTTFHAVDYNDTEFIAHQAMPSNKYVNLTLPASGNTITAPADGYFAVGKNSTASGQRLRMWYRGTNSGDLMSASSWSSGIQNLEISLYVTKGSAVAFIYTADGVTNYCRFIYANGAK